MAAPAEKVAICHVDPDGDGAGLETISVKDNPKTIEKHLAHGDHEGACFVCPDGFTDPPTEECDDGNNIDTDACLNSCQNAACGDGVVQTGIEQCDDGNTTPGDGCDESCFIEASTCAECAEEFLTAEDGCDNDFSCVKSALQALADCTLTCTGDFIGFPDFCFNEGANGFRTCIDSAGDDDAINTCGDAWITGLVTCAEPD